MSIERPKEYYDEIYKTSEKYKTPPSESEYYKLWLKIIDLIPSKEVAIVELGCGVGQFASLLKEREFINYDGYDFSEEAIIQANSKSMSGYCFWIRNLTNREWPNNENGFFIALELFEHTKDFKVIENIGLGKEIIFTVPDFNDQAHVRYFHSVNEVVERYKNVIKFEHVQKFEHWYICKGVTI